MRIIFLLMFLGSSLLSQDYYPNKGYGKRHYEPVVQIDNPVPIGGYDAILKYFIYPEEARADRVEGEVTIECVIDRDGHAMDAKAILGPKLLMRAAEDAVDRSQWIPARLDGELIQLRVRFDLDISVAKVDGLVAIESENTNTRPHSNLLYGTIFFALVYLIVSLG